MFKSIISGLLLITLLNLTSCGSDNAPAGSSNNVVTPGLQRLENMTEISMNEAKVLMQNNSQYNQVLNPGDRYVRTEMNYQYQVGQQTCKVKTTTTYTVLRYDTFKDELTSLEEAVDDYSVGTCSPQGTSTTHRNLYVERNFSKKVSMDNDPRNGGETHFFQGTLNGQTYLFITSKGSSQGFNYDIEVTTSPKRPLWTDADATKITLNGELYSTSTSTTVTHVDITRLNTRGLTTVTVDYNTQN